MASRTPLQDVLASLERDWPWYVGGLLAAGGIAYGARRLLGGPGLVTIIPIENHGLTQTIGNPSLPYLNQLARQYASCTNYRTTYHPSLPNYLIMTSGQSWGITDDGYHLVQSGGQDLFAQMTAAGVPWRAYAQSMGRPCRTSDSDVYASRHVPAVYYDSVVNSGACDQLVVDLNQLPVDLAADAVRFAFVTPDLQSDWHDGTASQLDAFLAQWIPQIVSSPGYQRNGVVIIVADENDSGTLVPCVVISENLRQSQLQDPTPYDHRSLCAGIQDWLGLGRLQATQGVSSLAGLTR
jgi:hypothetical protein